MNEIAHIEKFVAEEHEFFNELANQYPSFQTYDEIERGLRAVLRVLRERMPIEESFHLLAQLPSFMKLYFIEGWKYQEKPLRIKTADEFQIAVEKELLSLGEFNFQREMPVREMIQIMLSSMRKYVSEGEWNHILGGMPTGLHELFSNGTK